MAWLYGVIMENTVQILHLVSQIITNHLKMGRHDLGSLTESCCYLTQRICSQTARFMGPTRGPAGADRTHVVPMDLAIRELPACIVYPTEYARGLDVLVLVRFYHPLSYIRVMHSLISHKWWSLCHWGNPVGYVTKTQENDKSLFKPMLTGHK